VLPSVELPSTSPGHHAVLGAIAGCVIGHHEANKHAQEKSQQQLQGSSNDR
jgi:hypothetical protein